MLIEMMISLLLGWVFGSADGDCTMEDRKPEVYVECLLYIDGAPFGLPMRTRF